ncbi:MAG: prolipoprotein diacylglyceryl transferase [Kutzneria sp.]|nr:prolipoprotein diacylglyceryl transferase [Kutzneria sp.]MBV9846318.1 prolipoprotein diacylglyceryl transferase [Kutzneria sp.]
MVLASFPSPPQGVWFVGPIPIRAYALFIIVGIIVAIVWGERRFVARGGERGFITDVAVWAVPFGLVGGRLYHLATDWQKYFGPNGNPLGALAVWNGGLGIWGAIALGGVGALIACRRRGVPLTAVADAVAPGIVVAQAIGRLGNYFNQELYGRVTDVPWALEIFNRVDPSTGMIDPINGVAQGGPLFTVHPTFLYELLWDLAVAGLVVWADRRFRLGHGRAFALYVAGYTAGRFWIELMRDDEATHIFGVRVNVYVAGAVFLGAVIYLVVTRNRGPREDLAAVFAAKATQEQESGPAPEASPAPATDPESDTASEAEAAAGDEAGTGSEPADTTDTTAKSAAADETASAERSS